MADTALHSPLHSSAFSRSGGLRNLPVLPVLLAFVAFAFVLIYLAMVVVRGDSMVIFDLDREGTLPAWWSSMQLYTVSIVLALIALRNRRETMTAFFVGLLALAFLGLSADEAGMIHETVGGIVDQLLVHRSETLFVRSGIWFVFLGIPFAVFAAWIAIRLAGFAKRVPGTGSIAVLGMVLFIGGAVGMEIVSNFMAEGMAYTIAVALEEGAEMLGVSMMLWAAVRFAANHRATRSVVDSLVTPAKTDIV